MSARLRPTRRSKLTIAQFCMRVLFAKPLTGAERQARHRAKLRRLQRPSPHLPI